MTPYKIDFVIFKRTILQDFCALNSSLLCTIVTLSANLVRNAPSSTAESPPPITNKFLFLKNAPSHTAQ